MKTQAAQVDMLVKMLLNNIVSDVWWLDAFDLFERKRTKTEVNSILVKRREQKTIDEELNC